MAMGDAVLDDEQFRRLATYGTEERVEAGRSLYASGDRSYDFFLLLTATVDVVREATSAEPETSSTGAGRGIPR